MDNNNSGKDQMLLREIAINEYIAQGLKRKQVCNKVAARFNISPRTVERQYSKVLKQITEELSNSRENVRSELLTKIDAIYKYSMEEGKPKVALDACLAHAKLAKLDKESEAQDTRPKFINLTEMKFDKLKAVGDDD